LSAYRSDKFVGGLGQTHAKCADIRCNSVVSIWYQRRSVFMRKL